MAAFNEQDVERIAQAAAEKAVEEVLTKLGVDVSDVHATQQDFAHLRHQRIASDQVATWTRRVVMGAVITAATGLLITGIKAAIAGLLRSS